MGPKKSPIAKPVVSDTDLAAAKQLLGNQEELKRQRSNLTYYLGKSGMDKAFNSQSVAKKRDYLEAWFASRLADQRGKLSTNLKEEFNTEHEHSVGYAWMSKGQMMTTFGDTKVLSRDIATCAVNWSDR